MGVINLSPWQNTGTTIVQEQKVLVKESYITCNPTPNVATAKPIPNVGNITSTPATSTVNTGGVKGVSYISALRIQNEIHNSFWGNKFSELKKLFTLDSDKRTMKQIDTAEFNSAISGLSSDKKSLAYAYFLAINATEIHYVDMTMTYETLSTIAISALSLPASTKGKYIDDNMGGGVNIGYGGGTLTVVVMNSKADIGDYTYNPTGSSYARYSTPAELLAHEMLGHGYGRIHGSSTYRHEDAIQMSNLYWRVRGYTNFYRNGTWHGSGILLNKTTANQIPTHFIK